MSVSELSASAQNYLKAIWALAEWHDEPVTPSLIAQHVGVKLSSTSDAVRRLTEQGLLTHAPYGSVELTSAGREHAVAMVRRHRLIETFLVEKLGYSWDQVHDEAEVLEHAVSDFLIERIDELLGRPERDPHGDPIPAADGSVRIPQAHRLTDIDEGGHLLVERINDGDPELLRFFTAHGIGVGAILDVQPGAPFSEVLSVRTDGAAEPIALGRAATDAIYVSDGRD